MLYIVRYGLRIHNEIERVENISSYESMRGFIGRENIKEIREVTTNLGENWHLLTEAEYIKLAKAMGRDYFLDLDENSRVPDKILVDVWNRRLLIVGRKLFESKPEWIIWSKGADGVAGTKDDLVSSDITIPPAMLKNLIME